jgi:nitrite reductase (NADH) small subunit
MSAWIPVCTLDDLPLLGARRLERPQGAPVAVFRNADNEVFALLDRCPHKGGPLSQGIVSGRSVACPLHNWNISLDNGQVAAPDQGCTPAFAVKVEGKVVHLDRHEIATLGIDLPLPQAGPCGGSRPAPKPTPQQT